MSFAQRALKNIVGKGENACNQNFVFLHYNFYPIKKTLPPCPLPSPPPQKKNSIIPSTFKISSANAFNWEQSKILAV